MFSKLLPSLFHGLLFLVLFTAKCFLLGYTALWNNLVTVCGGASPPNLKDANKFSNFCWHKSVQIEPVVITQRIKLGACDYVLFVYTVRSAHWFTVHLFSVNLCSAITPLFLVVSSSSFVLLFISHSPVL
jgi:hypothetical protein